MKRQKRSFAKRCGDWLVKHGRKRYSIFALSGLSVGDFFIPALPTQTSVIALGLLQPRRGWLVVLMFSLASMVGAAILMALLLTIETYLSTIQPSEGNELYEHWLWLKALVGQYGLFALFAFSMLPTPPRLMVTTTVLAGLSLPMILATVFIGKTVWFGFVIILLRYFPGVLKKIPALRKTMEGYEQKYLSADKSITQP